MTRFPRGFANLFDDKSRYTVGDSSNSGQMLVHSSIESGVSCDLLSKESCFTFILLIQFHFQK